MAIQNIVPNFGTVGTDIEIQGTGFLNATGVEFAGADGQPKRAPFVADSDTVIRASVPTGAVTGAITVLDPDGNQISAAPFVVRNTATTPPEQTPRGRQALDAIVLALAYKGRNDNAAVSNAFARSVVIQTTDGIQNFDYPTGPMVTPAQIQAYQNDLAQFFPNQFNLNKMIVNGSVVEVFGDNGGDPGDVRLLLREGANGFQIISLTRVDL